MTVLKLHGFISEDSLQTTLVHIAEERDWTKSITAQDRYNFSRIPTFYGSVMLLVKMTLFQFQCRQTRKFHSHRKAAKCLDNVEYPRQLACCKLVCNTASTTVTTVSHWTHCRLPHVCLSTEQPLNRFSQNEMFVTFTEVCRLFPIRDTTGLKSRTPSNKIFTRFCDTSRVNSLNTHDKIYK